MPFPNPGTMFRPGHTGGPGRPRGATRLEAIERRLAALEIQLAGAKPTHASQKLERDAEDATVRPVVQVDGPEERR
jgi:hypothetical protein